MGLAVLLHSMVSNFTVVDPVVDLVLMLESVPRFSSENLHYCKQEGHGLQAVLAYIMPSKLPKLVTIASTVDRRLKQTRARVRQKAKVIWMKSRSTP